MSEIHNADWLARQHNKKSDHVTGDWVTLHKAVKPIADALCPEGKATSEKPTNSPHWWVIYDGHFSAFENEIKNGDWEARDGNGVKSKSIDYTTMVKRSDEVWAALQPLAQQKKAPLIGATEDGLQYLQNGECKIFKRDSLRKRLSG